MKRISTLLFFVAMITSLMAVTIPGGTRFYLTPNDNWKEADARFSIYFFGDGDGWVSMTPVAEEPGTYVAISPTNKNYTNLIFTRMNPGTVDNNWSNKWNQTADLVYDGTNNHYVMNPGAWDGEVGSWSYFEPPISPSVNLSVPTSIYIGESISLDATTDNISNPVVTFYVKTPSNSNFEAVSSPYTPESIGTYTFKADAKQEGTSEVLATDEKVVIVKEVPADFTVMLHNSAEWSKVYIFVWGTQDDGFKEMNLIKDNWYAYKFTKTEVANFVFVNANDWEADGKEQTVDITGISTDSCFELGEPDPEQENKRTVAQVNCPDLSTNVETIEESNHFWTKDGHLHLQFDNEAKQIELFSISGQIVIPQTSVNHLSHSLDNGIYILRIDGKSHKVMIK